MKTRNRRLLRPSDTPKISQGDEQHIHILNTVLSAATEFISMFDAQGSYLYASENIALLLGLKQSDFLGKTWQEVGLPAEFMEPFDVQRRTVMATGRMVREEMCFPVGNEMRWFSYVASPVVGEHKEVVSVVVAWHDITERKQTEEATYQLASIVGSSGDAIFSKNLEGVITTWNGSAEKLFGYTAAEMIGQTVSFLLPPYREAELLPVLERVRAGETIQNLEAIRMRKDGTSIEVSVSVSPIRDAKGRIMGESTIARDITARKQAAAVIQELSRQKIDILESITDAFYAVDMSWHFTYVNTQAVTILRKKHEELLGRSLWELFPESVDSLSYQQLHKAMAEGVSVEFERFYPPHERWYEIHAYPSSSGLAVYLRDVNAKKEAVEALRLSEAHLRDQAGVLEMRSRELEHTNNELSRQHDQLTSLNSDLEQAKQVREQFLATMSHELRTPLTSIIGFSEMLLEDALAVGWNPEQYNNLERILKNSEHLLCLINDVLDLSKIEAGRMEVEYKQVNVRELLNSVTEETLSMAVARDLFLNAEIAEGVVSLESNALKLGQILLNLVSNAIKFTEHGGVTLSARQVFLSDQSEQRTEGIAFTVQDSGIGIPSDMQERIFEAFYQIDGGYTRKYGGTGLGLSIVRQLTALLGGTIEMTSTPGQGSTFSVLLPMKAVPQNGVQEISPLNQTANLRLPHSSPPLVNSH